MKTTISLVIAIGCINANAITANYDLLGRKGSKMNSPMVYKDSDYAKMKKDKPKKIGSSLINNNSLAKKASGLENGVNALEGRYFSRGWTSGNGCEAWGACFYNTKVYRSSNISTPLEFNKYNLYQYGAESGLIENINNYFIDIPKTINRSLNEHNNETFTNLNGYNFSTYNIDFNVINNRIQPSPYENGQQIQYTDFEYIRESGNYSERPYISIWYGAQNSLDYGAATNPYTPYTWAVDWVNDWGKVGIYMPTYDLPVKFANNDEIQYVQTSSNSYRKVPGHEMLMSKAFKIIKNSSKNSVVYVGSDDYYQDANVFMGLRIRPNVMGNVSTGKFYSTAARNLDNFIYNNRTVEIVAAGNSGKNFANIAHAANAITVGAVDPINGYVTGYTPTVKPRYCINGIGNCTNNSPNSSSREGTTKPEINNYSHFYFSNDKGRTYNSTSYIPYYNGTESAAAYTAGMVSDLLATNAFYRRHPEVVKALLLTSASTKGVPTYATMLPGRSNPIYTYMHDSRYWIGDINTLKTHDGTNGRKEIRFVVDMTQLPTKNVTAAISWLSSGDDIANLGKIPQDFDLFVYEGNDVDGINTNNYAAAKTYSQSSTDAFEKVSFSTNYPYVVFRIVLYSDDANSENHGQIILGFDLMSH